MGKTKIWKKELRGNQTKMKNKHGWIKIVEALVAILLIAGFITLVLERNSENTGLASDIYDAENFILREIQSNSQFRNYILGVGTSVEFNNFDESLKNHIISRTPEYLECTGKICDLDYDSACTIDLLKKDVYVRTAMITANEDIYDPKLIKLFCWTAE